MNTKTEQIPFLVKKAAKFIIVSSVTLAFLSFLFSLLTHYPFFDESVRVRMLWLMSEGLKPNVDYFTPHPSLGYLLSLPLMNILPDSAYSYLGLRCLSLLCFAAIGAIFFEHGKKICNDWSAGLIPFLLVITAPALSNYCVEYSIDHISAIFAIGSFILMFGDKTPKNLFLLAVASTLSILIMPKFLHPLFFGAMGAFIAAFLCSKKTLKTASPPIAGIIVTIILVAIFFALNGLSLPYDINHSFLLHARLAAAGNSNVASGNDPVALRFVFEHLLNNPVLFCSLAIGLSGWLYYSIKTDRAHLFAGSGILLGVIASSLMMRSFLEQYVTPILLCLAVFVPFGFACLKSPLAKSSARLALGLAAFITFAIHLKSAANQFKETPFNGRGATAMHQRLLGSVALVPTGISKLSEYERLLAIIPPNETVAAVWPNHPIFRRDPTFVGVDDIPTHALGLKATDPLLAQFNPETYRAAIIKNPPAFISPTGMEVNYPPGWMQVTLEFLALNQHRYTPFADGYLRTDLLPRQYNIQ